MGIGAQRFSAAARLPESDEAHRCAYNGAFWDLGFKWQWDADTYRELCCLPEEKGRILAYIERCQPHLLTAYDADFLVELIYINKVQRHSAVAAALAAGEPLDLSCNGLKAAER